MLSLLLCPSVLLGLGEKFWLLEHKFYWADSPLPYEGLGSKVIHLPPVEHLKTVWGFFLIICVNLFPGYQICRHITSQEKEVSSTLALSMVFLTRASSKEATITVFQALQSLLCLMQSCKHPLLRPFHIRARFFFFSPPCVFPILGFFCISWFFWLLWWHVAGGFRHRRCLSAPADEWVSGSWSGTARTPSLIPPFEGQVSCALVFSSPLGRSLPCFLWITRKRRREARCRLPAPSLLGKQRIYFQGSCMFWACKCETLSEAAVVHVTIHPFHIILLLDSEMVTLAYRFYLQELITWRALQWPNYVLVT